MCLLSLTNLPTLLCKHQYSNFFSFQATTLQPLQAKSDFDSLLVAMHGDRFFPNGITIYYCSIWYDCQNNSCCVKEKLVKGSLTGRNFSCTVRLGDLCICRESHCHKGRLDIPASRRKAGVSGKVRHCRHLAELPGSQPNVHVFCYVLYLCLQVCVVRGGLVIS